MPEQMEPLTPVDANRVTSLCASHGLRDVLVTSVVETESTNADAVALVNKGITGWNVIVAATQTAGRGRLDRSWTDQGEDSLSFSLAFRVPPIIPAENWGWIPLLAGTAVAIVLRAHGVDAKTKWPNDVIITQSNPSASPETAKAEVEAQSYKKLVGILSEAVGGNAVVGIGINLTTKPENLPVSEATSAAIEGGTNLTREGILAEIIVEFDKLWQDWCDRYGDAARSGADEQYAELSATIGSKVTITGVPTDSGSEQDFVGEAVGVDREGRLIVTRGDDEVHVSVGDITHLR